CLPTKPTQPAKRYNNTVTFSALRPISYEYSIYLNGIDCNCILHSEHGHGHWKFGTRRAVLYSLADATRSPRPTVQVLWRHAVKRMRQAQNIRSNRSTARTQRAV